MGLNALHVPLVDHGDRVLGLQRVQLAEDTLIPVVDEDGLLLGGSLVEESHKEVDAAAVERFGEGLPATDVDGFIEVLVLTGPGRGGIEGREEGPPDEGVEVEVGLQPQRLNGDGIEVDSAENLLCLALVGVFEGVGGLEAGTEEVEIVGESCVW
jgi:hypothetical protein